MTDKSRTIPVQEFYSNLQLEYLSYKLRETLYEREIDEKIFHDICKGKRGKISKYSIKNCVPSIFTSPETLNKYINIFLNDFGTPKFQYTPKNKNRLSFYDKVYFFKEGVEIVFEGKFYNVLRNLPNSNEVEVLVDNSIKSMSYSKVSRDVRYILEKIH
jgi:hypothetical protein